MDTSMDIATIEGHYQGHSVPTVTVTSVDTPQDTEQIGINKNWIETCIISGIIFAVFLTLSVVLTIITCRSIEGLKPFDMGAAVVLIIMDRVFWMITAVFGMPFLRTLWKLKGLHMDKQMDSPVSKVK